MVLIVPVTTIYVFSKKKDTLNKKKFRQKWGAIYSEYKEKTKITLSYRFIFCLRRIAFVTTILIFDETPAFQLLILLYLNLGMTFYIAQKPFKRSSSNIFEMINEFMMSSICYSCILVTGYLPEMKDKY